jgi:predicted transcriptional regulator
MDTANSASFERADPVQPESVDARQKRIAREAALIAQARKSAASGQTVSEERVDAWIDSLGTAHPLPPPRSDD